MVWSLPTLGQPGRGGQELCAPLRDIARLKNRELQLIKNSESSLSWPLWVLAAVIAWQATYAPRPVLAGSREADEALTRAEALRKGPGSFEETIQAYQKALSLNPDNAEAHYRLGTLYHISQQLQLAISEYQATLRLDPQHVGALNNLGLLYFRTGRTDDAQQKLKRATELRPTDPIPASNLALLYLRLGQKTDSAIRLLNQDA